MTQIDTSTETIEALLKDVTPGPWDYEWTGSSFYIGDEITVHDKTPSGASLANFIHSSRELVPALLAERDALKAKLAKAEGMLGDLYRLHFHAYKHIAKKPYLEKAAVILKELAGGKDER